MAKKNNTLAAVSAQTFDVPSLETATPISQIAGENIPWTSLKKHPEWNGLMMMVVAADIKQGTIPDKDTGEVGDYIVAACVIYPEGTDPRKSQERHIVNISSGNVMGRIRTAITANNLPAIGKLEAKGRAWLWN